MRGGFLLWAAAAAGFGGLLPRERRALSDADAPEAPAAFTAAADECRERIGHTLGEVWMQCVVDRLLVAMGDPTSTHPPFATVPHTFDPLAPLPSHAGEAGYASSHRLKDLLRDYSCDASGPGSTPSRRFAWTHTPHDPCAAAEREEAGGGVGGGGGAEGAFLYRRGFLPAGDSLGELDGEMSEAEALSLCASHAPCQGFTYASSERAHGRRHRMMFKSAADDVAAAEGWHSFKRRAAPVDCSPPPGASRRPPPPAVEYSVGVLREEPPIYVVDGFVSRAECEAMVNATVPRMGRSVVSGGGFSAARRSYSVNMYPEYDDPNRPVTALARRLFAFAREAAGYETLMEGPGQEPVNAVYYKDDGDQYRAHCDGECNGGPWREGKRIATGLVYCETADRGGDTLFTRVGLKVVPKPGQLLFFGYKLRDEGSPTGWAAAMDNGVTEHSGCPLREGRKWIATMWFREGVSAERPWDSLRDL